MWRCEVQPQLLLGATWVCWCLHWGAGVHLLHLLHLLHFLLSSQSPFWFLTRPIVENLLDDEGRILSNKVISCTLGQCTAQVRVKWGAMHNFKCVDYFQVEYNQVPSNTVHHQSPNVSP